MYRNLHPGDNRHVVINNEKYFSTSSQVAAHLLCRECEQRFNRNGEKWVSENGFRGQGNFRLQSVLRNSPRLGKTRSSLYFAGVEMPEVNMDQLCYFGASVFWRGSAPRWDGGDSIDLGPVYKEQFRRFLMDEIAFPANAILQLHVSNAYRPMEGAFFPSGGRVSKAGFHKYTFMLPGMLFTLALGGRTPPNLRSLCAVHSEKRLIFLSSKVEDIMKSMAEDMIAENEMVRREILEGVPPRKV